MGAPRAQYAQVTGGDIPLADLFKGISGHAASGFTTSAVLIVVIAASAALVGAGVSSRVLILCGAMVAAAVLIDRIVLEAVTRAPGDFVAADLRAGAWMAGAGSLLLL